MVAVQIQGFVSIPTNRMGMKLVVVVVVDICRVDASNWGYGRISCVGGVMVV